MPIPEYEVQWAYSIAKGRKFPVAMLVADTDYATLGYGTLSSTKESEVVIVTCSAAEMNDPVSLEARVNAALSRDDLRTVRLVRSTDNNEALVGIPFQEFRKSYRRPTLYFSDILAGHGEAEGKEVVSAEQFLAAGGRVRYLA